MPSLLIDLKPRNRVTIKILFKAHRDSFEVMNYRG